MDAIGDTTTPVFVDNNGDAKPCTKKLHSVTVQDLGDPDGPLLAYIVIDSVKYPIHDKKYRERLLVTEDKEDDFIFSDGSYIRYTDN